MAQIASKIRSVSYMGPSNDHELAIARIADRISIDGRLFSTSAPEVFAAVTFKTSKSDDEFLVRYVQWRVENPIAKSAGR